MGALDYQVDEKFTGLWGWNVKSEQFSQLTDNTVSLQFGGSGGQQPGHEPGICPRGDTTSH